MKALHLALLSARAAAGVLPRDETSASRAGAPAFSYPSQDAIQEEARRLDEAGLLLLPDGAELDERASTATFSWTLIHVETGERLVYVLPWPLFRDMDQLAHQVSAAWSHAWGRLVMQLLALRVAPRAAVEAAPAPWPRESAPWLGPHIGTVEPRDRDRSRGYQAVSPRPPVRGLELEPLPSWAEPAPPRPAAVPARTRPSWAVGPFSSDALIDAITWWSEKEHEHDQAEGRPPTRRGVVHAWARSSGEPVDYERHLSAAEREALFLWLVELERMSP